MRFEVEITADLDVLHQAREAYNAANQSAPAPDLPSYVQVLMDQAVNAAVAPIGPATMADALAQIKALSAQVAEQPVQAIQLKTG